MELETEGPLSTLSGTGEINLAAVTDIADTTAVSVVTPITKITNTVPVIVPLERIHDINTIITAVRDPISICIWGWVSSDPINPGWEWIPTPCGGLARDLSDPGRVLINARVDHRVCAIWPAAGERAENKV